MSYTPSVGEKLQAVFPVVHGSESEFDLLKRATEAMSLLCGEHGMTPTDVSLVSAKPWTEPFGGLDPQPDMDLYTYEATANRALHASS